MQIKALNAHSFLAVLLLVVTAFLLCVVPVKAKSALGGSSFNFGSELENGVSNSLTLLEKSLSCRSRALGICDGPENNLPPKTNTDTGPVQELEVDGFKDLKKREVVGDNLEHDHIPSSAALIKSVENQLGRRLTDAERRQVHNQGTAVEVSKDIHKDSRTFRGRNTSEQIKNDADDLATAACKDCDTLRANAQAQGRDLNDELVG